MSNSDTDTTGSSEPGEYIPWDAKDVTDEILDVAVEITDSFFQDRRIDWDNVWDRMEGKELKDGSILYLPEDTLAPAFSTIQRHVRQVRKRGQ